MSINFVLGHKSLMLNKIYFSQTFIFDCLEEKGENLHLKEVYVEAFSINLAIH